MENGGEALGTSGSKLGTRTEPNDQVTHLSSIALDDLVAALGWLGRRPFRPLVRRAGRPAARRFAEEVAAFDRCVERAGLVAAARALLARHVGALAIRGRDDVPFDRPVLFVANHPGLADALALIVAIDDDRLTLVAADRPFFRATPSVNARLIPVPAEEARWLATFRAIVDRLAARRPVATFPTGEIEPDPLIHSDAFAAVARWPRQLGAIRRRLPDLAVVPVAIGGVLTQRALRHPLARLQPARADRERAAAMLQVVLRSPRPRAVRLAFGPPLQELDAPTLSAAYHALERALRAETGWTPVLGEANQPATSR